MTRSRLITTTDLSGLTPVLADGVAIHARYERLRAALETQAPDAATLFAEPVLGAATPTGFKSAAWYGVLTGEPVPLGQLSGAAHADALATLRQGMEALARLFADDSLRSWLRAAFIIPSPDSILVADKRVLLVNWGFVPANLPQTEEALERQFVQGIGGILGWQGFPRPSGAGPVAIPTAAAAAVAASAADSTPTQIMRDLPPPAAPWQPPPASVTMTDKPQPAAAPAVDRVAPPPPQAPPAGRRSLLLVLGLSLFLLGVIVGLFFLSWRSAGIAGLSPSDTSKVDEALRQGLVEERNRLQDLLRDDVCRLPPDTLPGRVLERPPRAPGDGRSGAVQPPVSTTPAEQSCQTVETPAQLMLVMDTSGSMQLPAGNRPDLVELEREANAGNQEKQRQLQALVSQVGGRRRMDDARSAASDFIDALPPKVEMGIASFSSGCGAKIDLSPTTDRGRAKAILEGMRGDGPTPIAESLRLMREAFGSGANDASRTIIVITDGHETCKGDPCAEAQQLASLYKNLKIHVIDVTGASGLQCLATATNGTIAKAGDLQELKAAVARAATDVRRQVTCAPSVEPGKAGGPGQSAAIDGGKGQPGSRPPTDPGQGQPGTGAPAAGDKGANPGHMSLNEQLERSAALIIAADIGSIGSGFFVGPDLLVTSRHVIQGKEGLSREILITSRALGHLYQGDVVAASSSTAIGGRDYAVIRLREVPKTAPVVLPIAQSAEKRVTVIAAGYPGYLVQNDPAMKRLAQGDRSAAPELILSEGKVQVTHQSASGVPIIVHSADISQGNSGGPLVDACGRIVAINTFIGVDPKSGRRGLFSLGGSDLLDFLKSKQISARTDTKPCEPN